MLDGSGDTHRDIEVRRNDLAGLANLHVIARVPGIHGSARCAHGGAKRIGEPVDQFEVFLAAQGASAGNDPGAGLQIRPPVAGVAAKFDEPRMGRKLGFHGAFPNLGRTGGFSRLVRCGSDGGHHRAVRRRLHRENGIAGVDRPLEPIRAFGAHDIAQLSHAKECRDPRHQILAEGGRRAEDVSVIGSQITDLGRGDCRQGKFVCRMIDSDDAGHPRQRRRLGCDGTAVSSQHRYVDR